MLPVKSAAPALPAEISYILLNYKSYAILPRTVATAGASHPIPVMTATPATDAPPPITPKARTAKKNVQAEKEENSQIQTSWTVVLALRE